MIPVPDFGGVCVIIWAIMSVPILSVVVVGIMLGSNVGAEAVVRLPPGRRCLACTFGCVVGFLCFGGFFVFGLFFVNDLIALTILSSVSSVLLAYQSARFISCQLNWCTCLTCGVRFRSPFISHECRPCAKEADGVNLERAQPA